MKRIFLTTYRVLLFLVCLGILLASLGYFCVTRYLRVNYEPAALSDSAALLDNPYCGFYALNGYILSEDNTADTAAQWIAERCSFDPYQLILLEVNLKNYANTTISENGLDQLDQLLAGCEEAKKQVILRFLYDWDGKAQESEPDDISTIKNHMAQVAAVVNEHAPIVFILQGSFTGNVGEMNGSKFGTPDEVRELIMQLYTETDSQIYLSVRTPAQLRSILYTFSPLSSTEAYSGSPASRLGLYNDGMLGSVYDLGTYDDTPLNEYSDISEAGTREEELIFQDKLCQYVPNGGEVTIDNVYNDLENAIADLSLMHVSYLNSRHDLSVLEKWQNSIYRGDDVFSGCTGYDYIQAHLGYRYTLKESSLDFHSFASDRATLYFTITNEGFASAYRSFDSSIIAYNEDTGKAFLIEAGISNRRIASQSDSTFKTTLDVRSWEKGTYQLTLVMTDPATEQVIHFAHAGYEEADGVLIGTLTID